MSGKFAIIVGSGFDAFAASDDVHHVTTRFGEPSAPVRCVEFEGSEVLVLARHGDTHALPPHVVNYRANLAALQELGAESVIGLNTVGVVSAIRGPGQIAVPDQIIDYTWGRAHTIYDEPEPGFAHVEFTAPFSAGLRVALMELGLEYACLSLIVNKAAGRGDKPIHDDVESSTLSATTQALHLLKEFFGSR
jgi:5'-methylthioinosine phosphorylase